MLQIIWQPIITQTSFASISANGAFYDVAPPVVLQRYSCWKTELAIFSQQLVTDCHLSLSLSLFVSVRVDEDRLRESSPVLARLFLQSIFISVDIRIREGHLFCDCLCDSGPLYSGQVSGKKFPAVNGLIYCYLSCDCESTNQSVFYIQENHSDKTVRCQMASRVLFRS